jgi:anti-anti-sigma factor
LLLVQEGEPMVRVQLNSRECGDRVVVALRGELDILDSAAVAAELAALAVGGRQIIADLECLNFLDCRGMSALVRALNLARNAGGNLQLAAPQPNVRLVLEVTGLARVFSVHASVEDAAADTGQTGREPRHAPGSLVRPCR